MEIWKRITSTWKNPQEKQQQFNPVRVPRTVLPDLAEVAVAYTVADPRYLVDHHNTLPVPVFVDKKTGEIRVIPPEQQGTSTSNCIISLTPATPEHTIEAYERWKVSLPELITSIQTEDSELEAI